MKDLRLYLLTGPILGALFTLSSCVNTETVQPEMGENKTNRIVLNLSAPEDVATRATEGFKLRYVAKIFNGSKKNLNASYYNARQELIQGEKGGAGKENQMVFDVEANQNYIIFVFADYIPETSQPSSEGYYDDYYYDTREAGTTGIGMLGTPSNLDSKNITESFFNNDNYDCFAGYVDVGHKGEEKIETSLTLERIVSKVRFVDTTEIEGDFNIEVSKVSYLYNYDLNNESSTPLLASNSNKHSLGSKSFKTGEESESLYFYTFPSIGDASPSLTFTITDPDKDMSDGSSNHTTITAEKIKTQKNFITTVKGNFLHGIYPEMGSEEETTKGYIYLDLSISDKDWSSDETNWK